jgi:hypothetical protein
MSSTPQLAGRATARLRIMIITLQFGMAVDATPPPQVTYDGSLNVPLPEVNDYVTWSGTTYEPYQVAQRTFDYTNGDLRVVLFANKVGPKITG